MTLKIFANNLASTGGLETQCAGHDIIRPSEIKPHSLLADKWAQIVDVSLNLWVKANVRLANRDQSAGGEGALHEALFPAHFLDPGTQILCFNLRAPADNVEEDVAILPAVDSILVPLSACGNLTDIAAKAWPQRAIHSALPFMETHSLAGNRANARVPVAAELPVVAVPEWT